MQLMAWNILLMCYEQLNKANSKKKKTIQMY
jgi:hypothetical protein